MKSVVALLCLVSLTAGADGRCMTFLRAEYRRAE